MPMLIYGQWIQQGNDIDGEAINDQSGYSISLNTDGTIVAIGSPFNVEAVINSGQVRVFQNQSDNWVQIGDNINGNSPSSISGFSVSLNADGTIVAIGAPDYTESGLFEVGQVRIFQNQSGNWVQMGNPIIGEAFSDHSGFSISLNNSGSILAIGAPDNEAEDGGNFGHVRVYEFQTNNWIQIGSDIDGEAPEDNSGFSVSINQDGSIVAIGAPNNNDAAMGAGHVRIYRNESNIWTQIGNDIDGEAINDKFGSALSLNDQGTIIGIGAIDHNGIGHVKVYENQSDAWVQIGNNINGEAIGDKFGISVSLNAVGDIVAVGARDNSDFTLEAGQVRVYKNESGDWQQINDDINGETLQDRSGISVSLNNEGSIVAIGAYLNDDNGSNAGHVRVFENTSVLNISEHNFDDVLLYPNPATNQIFLNLGNTHTTIKVSIFDVVGKQVYSQKYNTTTTNTISINTNNYTKGLYLIKVFSKNKQTTFKFIKS
jgi:hypothetical protein